VFDWRKKHKFRYPIPTPVEVGGKKYCPECWKNDIKKELRGHRQFLCKDHYKEFRREREKVRIKLKREGYEQTPEYEPYGIVKTIKEKEYNTKLGTSDFSSHLTKTKNKDGTPNFKNEKKYVKNELTRITNFKTIGDIANRAAGGKEDSHKPESRERLLETDCLAYKEDMSGYVQYDNDSSDSASSDSAIIIEEWDAHLEDEDKYDIDDIDEFFKKPEKKEPMSLIEKYKDWDYYSECNTI